MSGWNPLIADWMSRGLEWMYLDQTTLRIFEIPAGGQFQLPVEKFTFKYPEGVILHFSAGFDHPSCGVRIEAYPEFDTENRFTAGLLAGGLSRPDILLYALVPPVTPAGSYSVRIESPYVWEKWLRLYLINTDSIPHRVLGHGYHIAVLKKERPKE